MEGRGRGRGRGRENSSESHELSISIQFYPYLCIKPLPAAPKALRAGDTGGNSIDTVTPLKKLMHINK